MHESLERVSVSIGIGSAAKHLLLCAKGLLATGLLILAHRGTWGLTSNHHVSRLRTLSLTAALPLLAINLLHLVDITRVLVHLIMSETLCVLLLLGGHILLLLQVKDMCMLYELYTCRQHLHSH